MTTDLTFFTNEPGQTLLDRFKVLLGRHTRFFDCLVGYFFSTGFYTLYSSFETTEKIRILIGIGTDRETVTQVQETKRQQQLQFQSKTKQTKEAFSESLTGEMSGSPDSFDVETGVIKFVEWLKSGKLEIHAYPSEKIHAKVYIMTFVDDSLDKGRVITGSSNFTEAGLRDNLEFNVELKNRNDYEFALEKFNQLWEQSVNVSEEFIETIDRKTWLNPNITPYELYLKFLYEYFRADLTPAAELSNRFVPIHFKKLEYQEQAVINAKRILEEYGGVFLSDVVGLGKTYISALLANELGGRNLVIAPPVLLDKNNPGSWYNVFLDFRVTAEFESVGKLEELAQRGTDRFDAVFIDEAHAFRNESTQTYEYLSQICRGKKVVLVTATPLNNSPKDILSQIKLFQKGKNSTIPNLTDLNSFFSRLEKKLRGVNRITDPDQYMRIVSENAQEIREKVLKYLMVRRTRSEVTKYFGDDLRKQKLRFPDVADPKGVFYEFDSLLDKTFNQTVALITSPNLRYARYKPATYLIEGSTQPERLAQENLGRFMKVLLVKRLDSSFHAFRLTVSRFIESYKRFIDTYEKGFVFIGKEYINKILYLLEEDEVEEIERYLDEGKVEKHEAKEFKPEFIQDLKSDLEVFKKIHDLWATVTQDPKLDALIKLLKTDEVLSEIDTKVILFTESKETAEYLTKHLSTQFADQVLMFTGLSAESSRIKVIENFDARAREQKNEFRILVTTEVLAEGVNLHRSNAVINFDIPWNPTRMMQRVGRINRVDTTFQEIFTFNFFPTEQSNTELGLAESAKAKIAAFIEMLGADARLLTQGEEIKSHDLFTKLNSKNTITGEDEFEQTELKYLQIIRDIRDNDVELFDRIKKLPKKACSGKALNCPCNSLLSYFRRRKLEKFYLSDGISTKELDFFDAAKLFESSINDTRHSFGPEFYQLLEQNKEFFNQATIEDMPLSAARGGDTGRRILKILRSNPVRLFKGFTEDDEEFLEKVTRLLEEGSLPKHLLARLHNELSNEIEPMKIFAILKRDISRDFFKAFVAQEETSAAAPVEVILSEYLVAG